MTIFTANEKKKKKNLIAIVPTKHGFTHYLAKPKKNKKKC